MKLAIGIKKTTLALPLLLLLAGCGAQEPVSTDPGVEDLEPGQRSVIAPPSGQNAGQSGVQEKSL